MAWNYARYIGRVVEAGKAEYPLPMFVNAALIRSFSIADEARMAREPGTPAPSFNAGGPMDDLMDVWRAGAPRLDMLSPDAYGNFAEYCARYARSGNPLFIPESLNGAVGAARVLYAFGRHDAIGFSAMGAVERSNTPDTDLIGSYDLLAQLAPLILQHQGNGAMSAVLLGPDDPPQKVRVGNYTLEAAFMKPRVAPLTQPTPIPPNTFASAIFIAAGPGRVLRGWQRRNPHLFSRTHRVPRGPAWPPWKKAVSQMAAGFPAACWPATAPKREKA